MENPIEVQFMRITVIGASNSGKTALVNSFVNGLCPQRYIPTSAGNIYYKRHLLDEDSEYDLKPLPLLIEIEDTPGSEKADVPHDDDDDDDDQPTMKKGNKVSLRKDQHDVQKLMKDYNSHKGTKTLRWRDGMESMLGKDHAVKESIKAGIVGLQSIDNVDGGVWYFPEKALTLKVSLELPIDKFLTAGEKPPVARKKKPTPKELKQLAADRKHPMRAFTRVVGNPDMDKTLTKNRMGFLIVFDMSDRTSASLKEAMNLHDMIIKVQEKQAPRSRIKPVIMMVGCKEDQSDNYQAIQVNKFSALTFSEEHEVQCLFCSAKLHTGITAVFNDILALIQQREVLWSQQTADDDIGPQDEGEEGCVLS